MELKNFHLCFTRLLVKRVWRAAEAGEHITTTVS
jgi:hypothetical protein